jgi:hypothetical protein
MRLGVESLGQILHVIPLRHIPDLPENIELGFKCLNVDFSKM